MSLNDEGRGEMRRDWVRRRQIWPEVASCKKRFPMNSMFASNFLSTF